MFFLFPCPAVGQCEQSKLVPADGSPFHGFSFSVSTNGRTSLIGAPGDNERAPIAGAAYVAVPDGEGSWSIQQKVLASDGSRDDRFGWGGTLSEQTAFMGAIRRGIAGAVYVFEPDEDGLWVQVQKLLPQGGTLGAQFGGSLSVDQGILIGGAGSDNVRFPNDGAAYVFERDERGSWIQTAKLVAPDPNEGARFGFTVGVSGTTAVCGAFNDNERGPNAGAAYVFDRGKDGVWRHTAKLIGEEVERGDSFGYAVAIHGNRVIVGAILDNDHGSESGSAYVFERDFQGAWSQMAKIVPPTGHAGQWFGRSVALQGDRALIGAPREDAPATQTGALYVYDLDDDLWTLRSRITASDADEGDFFGSAVAMNGDTVLIGAEDDDENGRESGSAYVFDLASLTPDLDSDGDVDLDDYALFASCLTGPEGGVRTVCTTANLDCDNDVDLRDFVRFQTAIP